MHDVLSMTLAHQDGASICSTFKVAFLFLPAQTVPSDQSAVQSGGSLEENAGPAVRCKLRLSQICPTPSSATYCQEYLILVLSYQQILVCLPVPSPQFQCLIQTIGHVCKTVPKLWEIGQMYHGLAGRTSEADSQQPSREAASIPRVKTDWSDLYFSQIQILLHQIKLADID